MASINAPLMPASSSVPNLEQPPLISRSLLRLRVPVNVTYNDRFGRSFIDNANTELVSAWGATLECSYSVSWGQELLLNFANKEILARIVGQTGMGDRSHSYGICFLQEDQQFWGVSFPKLATHKEDPLVLECSRCGQTRPSALNEVEALVLRVNRVLLLRCHVCNDTCYWRATTAARRLEQTLEIQHSSAEEQIRCEENEYGHLETNPDLVPVASIYEADLFRPMRKAERRRHKRVSLLKAKACIERPETEPEVVEVINVSRSGACVRSSTFYPIGSWIRIACPYTIGGSNIFQSARVVRIATYTSVRDYGIEYVRLV